MEPARRNLVIDIPDTQPDTAPPHLRCRVPRVPASRRQAKLAAVLSFLGCLAILLAFCKDLEQLVMLAHNEGTEEGMADIEGLPESIEEQKLSIRILGRPQSLQSSVTNKSQDSINHQTDEGKTEKAAGQHLDQDRSRCPLAHNRIPVQEILEWKAKPYLLGENARPVCYNCKLDHLWAHHCQYKSHGPMCPKWLQWNLLDTWIRRAKQGAPGMLERLTMTPCDFFPHIRGRTLWLVGDSLTLEWHKAVHCFMYEFWDLEQVDLPGMDTPGYPMQAWCSNLAQNTRLCFLRANTAEEIADRVFPHLSEFGAKTSDIMVMNAAVWHNDEELYVRNMTKLARAFSSQRHLLPITLWRDAPAQHFSTPHGDFDWSPESDNCTAAKNVEMLADNTLRATEAAGQVTAQGGWRNILGLRVIQKLGINIIHTWNETLMMWEYHTNYNPNGGDCTHMCHPSEYQYWVYELYRSLRKLSLAS